jgi:hypothetical protein
MKPCQKAGFFVAWEHSGTLAISARGFAMIPDTPSIAQKRGSVRELVYDPFLRRGAGLETGFILGVSRYVSIVEE